jgi:hypothetical protein
MATDPLTFGGLTGLILIISGLWWENVHGVQAPKSAALANGLLAVSATPCPPSSRPRVVHSQLVPENLLPPASRASSV